jgi:hypothetical protein
MMNAAPSDELLFRIRYRLPRPISRSFEAVGFSSNPDDIDARIQWCSNAAIRFLAAVYQANFLAVNINLPVNPPAIHDFKLDLLEPAFVGEMEKGVPPALTRLSSIYADAAPGIRPEALALALGEILYLADYRLAVREEGCFRVLLGPRTEYMVWDAPRTGPGDVPDAGTVIFIDTRTGRYITLNPLLVWKREPREAFGHLCMLRRREKDRGHSIEEGVPGSPGFVEDLRSYPATGSLAGDPALLGELEFPPVRYRDGHETGDGRRIYGFIWRGGTSDIYVGTREGGAGTCVLKTFENGAAFFDENYWRFINEERFARPVSHGRVMKPRRIALGTYGLVYELDYVRRGSLQDVIDYNGVLTAETAVDITLQLLDALEAIHGAGVVHNDIKPDNILFDESGRIGLIDFGIASSPGEDGTALRPGVPAGSEGFMAPELKRGDRPSPQSDIYSTGALFARMISGRGVRDYEDVRAARSISKKFYIFLERCLHEVPGRRFATARQAAGFLADIQVSAERAVTLDIEGTLVTSYHDRTPRPGLYDFICFCMRRFDRIFVYTTLDEGRAAEIFSGLAGSGHVPRLFLEVYEYVEWDGGNAGALKDLRRCRVPLEHNLIVDDMKSMIPEDQFHRWIRVSDYNEPVPFDGELSVARSAIERKFNMS